MTAPKRPAKPSVTVVKSGGGAGNKLAAGAVVLGLLCVFGAGKTSAVGKDGKPKGAAERISESATNGLGEVASGIGKGTGVSDAVGSTVDKALIAGGVVAAAKGGSALAARQSANLAAARAAAKSQREALSKLKPPNGGGGGGGAVPVDESAKGRAPEPAQPPASTTTEGPRPTAPPTPEPPKGQEDEGRLPGMPSVTIAGGGRTQAPRIEPSSNVAGQLQSLPAPQATPIIQ